MAQIFLEGMTVDTLSDIIRKTVKEEFSKNGNQSITLSENNGYFTRKETAQRLKVSLVTLTEWVNKSHIKAYKIGGRVLFRKSEVENTIAQIVPLKHKRR